jgi:hypothetical protein
LECFENAASNELVSEELTDRVFIASHEKRQDEIVVELYDTTTDVDIKMNQELVKKLVATLLPSLPQVNQRLNYIILFF